MRDRAIDEFEAIFERAAVPVLDIQPLRLPRLSAVLMGDALDASILALAMYLRERFSASLRLHWPTTVADAVRAAIEMGAQRTVHVDQHQGAQGQPRRSVPPAGPFQHPDRDLQRALTTRSICSASLAHRWFTRIRPPRSITQTCTLCWW
jgi:hypothetical protein